MLPFLPTPVVGRAAVRAFWWLSWRGTKKVEDTQRHELGLPKATGSAPRRITERGSLEIQAYDEACFPGLAAEWARWKDQRPFVGTLTLELPTDADDEVASWIAGGNAADLLRIRQHPGRIAGRHDRDDRAACARLGERALVGAAGTDFSNVPHLEHVKVVGTMNYATVFPACRAVVHHGGSSTTPIVMRAGVPQLILYWDLVHAIYGAAVKRLKVGTARRFSTATEESLVADLRTILGPQYVASGRASLPPGSPSLPRARRPPPTMLENFARATSASADGDAEVDRDQPAFRSWLTGDTTSGASVARRTAI